MDNIVTRFYARSGGQSFYRAVSSDGHKLEIPRDYAANHLAMHRRAALRLATQQGTTGALFGSHIDGGMIWILSDDELVITLPHNDPIVCEDCGCPHISARGYIYVNTSEWHGDDYGHYCPNCDADCDTIHKSEIAHMTPNDTGDCDQCSSTTN